MFLTTDIKKTISRSFLEEAGADIVRVSVPTKSTKVLKSIVKKFQFLLTDIHFHYKRANNTNGASCLKLILT